MELRTLCAGTPVGESTGVLLLQRGGERTFSGVGSGRRGAGGNEPPGARRAQRSGEESSRRRLPPAWRRHGGAVENAEPWQAPTGRPGGKPGRWNEDVPAGEGRSRKGFWVLWRGSVARADTERPAAARRGKK